MYVLVHYPPYGGGYEPIQHYGSFDSMDEARVFGKTLEGRTSIFPLRRPEEDSHEEDT